MDYINFFKEEDYILYQARPIRLEITPADTIREEFVYRIPVYSEYDKNLDLFVQKLLPGYHILNPDKIEIDRNYRFAYLTYTHSYVKDKDWYHRQPRWDELNYVTFEHESDFSVTQEIIGAHPGEEVLGWMSESDGDELYLAKIPHIDHRAFEIGYFAKAYWANLERLKFADADWSLWYLREKRTRKNPCGHTVYHHYRYADGKFIQADFVGDLARIEKLTKNWVEENF